MKKLIFATLLPLLSAGAFATEYQIDPTHSSAQFAVRHMMVSNVKGEFSKVTGTIQYDSKNLAVSRVDAVIDATTLNTREAKRDEHLKSPDFLDVAKYPALTFKGKRFERKGDNVLMIGDLTIRGVTKEVALTVDGPTPEIKDPYGNLRFGASATTHISRKDWGLVWNAPLEAGGVVVGDDVAITLDIEATRVKEKTSALTSSQH